MLEPAERLARWVDNNFEAKGHENLDGVQDQTLT